ncbi:hypothetical protein ABMA28_007542 [Loxostege sticticalis]|uniref:Reverse transcriptase domain-containing protein n=1 Tax=Loxostege sticticalis TaxID=481309 RepID=A0ABD0SIL6_LOXSC
MNLKTDSAVGYDSIPNTFLKVAKDIIIPPLTILLKLCIEQGIFPKAFKKAIITPVHKGGDRDNVTNYRPISVLTSLSKILEKVLNKRLIEFLENHKILSDCQFGFRSKKSTEDAVQELTEFVTNNLDSKQKCVGIFLDLAKAFDTVSIPTLVDKLERIGIRGTALSIYSSFLSERVQKVKIGRYVSGEEPVSYGVPQGSILGPSLFLIYINDLCQMSLASCKIFTYADDTALVFHGSTWDEVCCKAEDGLHKVTVWLNENLLTLNLSKTTFLQFNTSKANITDLVIKAHTCDRKSDDSCSCLSIAKSSTVKYLGVLLDDQLTWKPHIELITSRIRKLIWVFKKLRYVADLDLLRRVYYALAQSILGYCVVTWGGTCKSHMIQIERAQRSLLKTMTFSINILRIILRQHRNTPYHPDKIKGKRVIKNVLELPKCRTAQARRQYRRLTIYLRFIPLHIIEEDSYEKDVLFYVNLGEPELLGDDDNPVVPGNEVTHLATLPEEEAVVAMMGLPRAGEITRAQLRIKESKEFKNTVDKLVQRANASIIIGTSSWKEQFTEALTASSGSDDPDEPPSWSDYILHIVTLFWKIIFAFVPPTDIGGGYVCFVVSIICIGLVTAVIGDVASHFGCTLGIKDSVTAIVFVALGTSIPDTFASKVAAIQDKYADASVGNVTGSNAVNVFLGIGVAWTVAAIVHWSRNEKFLVDPGNLAFSVTMFCSEACLVVIVLVLRRRKSIGGELGGPRCIKIITSIFFFSLWLIYLTMSGLEAYDIIQGF